jgi:hypothetical protein
LKEKADPVCIGKGGYHVYEGMEDNTWCSAGSKKSYCV